MKLITIKTYVSDFEAQLAYNLLYNEGITCYLFDEKMNSIYPLVPQAFGGIRLKVPENEVEKALSMLESFEKH